MVSSTVSEKPTQSPTHSLTQGMYLYYNSICPINFGSSSHYETSYALRNTVNNLHGWLVLFLSG